MTMAADLLSCDVAVIGAGPAGLAAAKEAAAAGADVLCLDLYDRPGGQYAMQPGDPSGPLAASEAARLGRDLAEAARAAGVRLLSRAELFWAAPEGEGFLLYAALDGGAGALAVRARAVVVAAGAMERPLPFPGWTLPGVIGAGAAQRLVKSGGALPFGGKVVLAGTGAFLMAVASTFAKAGRRIDHFVERQPLRPLSSLTMLAPWPSRWSAAAGLLADLRRTGAQQHHGHAVTRALGRDRLEAVEIAPVDALGRPDLSRAERIGGVGALCIGYGFQPVIDATTALGADHAHNPALGGWHCLARPDSGETSRPGLYAAGETCGIGGMRPALVSGRIAGLSAAARVLGRTPDPGLMRSLAAELAKARRFAVSLAAHWPAPEAPPVPLPEAEVICRCEDVRLSDIRAAVQAGAAETFAVKMWTRAGMGPCQGRVCGAALAAALAEAGVPPGQAGYNRAHLPLRPVPMNAVHAALARTARPDTPGTGPA
ncbi:FAD-dependent oxidoreductase [Rhodobacter sp. SGA-6-6]|uniref:FAD/NAD(P)-dependent oxidoreductase n=1 Tax=Rhodobacter sp. SGA-6-6 TaxID=2710882 RepID=UPI0013ED5B1B|nr:NAD(P)/FAD-dependent oxidoreductase [Rhodobacter sp. SGA-6-6]NGM44524.1 FAD-dependent oxidoreductase [Rhodobacter sp. SGA-6-6]